jgi:hypothetical protein
MSPSLATGQLPRDLFAGLAVTSHDPAILNRAVFDHVLSRPLRR